jgi:MFS family permease
MAGAFMLGSGLLLTSFTHSLWQLYMTFGLIGVGLCSGYVTTMTTISRSFTTRRGLALGILSAGIGFGPLIMAPLATHLIATGGWRFAYRTLASIVGFNIPVALLLKGYAADAYDQTRNTANNHRGADREKAPKGTHPLSGLIRVKWAFKSRVFWLFCLLFLLIGISVQTIMAHIVAYSQSEGASPMSAAAVLSTVMGASMAGRIAMGISSDWIGRKRTLVLCTFSEGVMILCLVGASSTSSFFLFGFLFGFFYGGHAPQLPALIGETLGLGSMGAILGVVNLFWGIGSTIGPFVTGYLFDLTGSYSIGFTIAAVMIFSASALGLRLKTSERKM